jgi:putative oxidoreductase
MSFTDRIAGPLLASMFVAGGIDALRNPEEKVKAAEAVVRPLTERLPALPRDTETFISFNAAVQIGGGALLALGRLRRIAALALIGSLIPTTYAGHRFWDEVGEERQIQQRIHFLKNVGLLGGLVSKLGADHRGGRSGRKTGHRS